MALSKCADDVMAIALTLSRRHERRVSGHWRAARQKQCSYTTTLTRNRNRNRISPSSGSGWNLYPPWTDGLAGKLTDVDVTVNLPAHAHVQQSAPRLELFVVRVI